jgi:uncharacterized membrane protein
MVLGFIWYGLGFGKVWMKLVGLKPEDVDPKDAIRGYIYSIIFSFITAWVLAIFMNMMNITGALSGLCLGAVIGIVFVAFTIFNNNMYEQRPVKLSFINSGYRVIYLMVIGAILGAWQ